MITQRGLAIAANAQLGNNWLIAKDWSEATRYRLSTQTQAQAEELFDAIADNSDGVRRWVKNHW